MNSLLQLNTVSSCITNLHAHKCKYPAHKQWHGTSNKCMGWLVRVFACMRVCVYVWTLRGVALLVQELSSTMWPLLILPHSAGAALHRARYFSGCSLLLVSVQCNWPLSLIPTHTQRLKLRYKRCAAVQQSDNYRNAKTSNLSKIISDMMSL